MPVVRHHKSFAGRAASALLLLAFATQAGTVEIIGGTEADRERMAEISDEWLSAYERGDLDAIMAIMHPDAILMPHNQATSRGTTAVREYFSTRIGRPGIRFVNELEEIRINGSWAFVLGSFAIEADAPDGDAPMIVHRGRYLVLYEKVDGAWLMLRDMDNLDPG